jgi:hypothetical protein
MYGLEVMTHLNRFTDQRDKTRYRNAQLAVRRASSLRQAVSTAGVFDELSADEAKEARAVLAALPAATADVILGAVRSALRRRLPAEVRWKQGRVIEVRVSETTTRVRILIVTPDGQRYVKGARRARSSGGRTRRAT